MDSEQTKKRTPILTFGSIAPVENLSVPKDDLDKKSKKTKRKNSKNRKKNKESGRPPLPLNMSINGH